MTRALAWVFGAGIAACATETPSKELIEARGAYEEASVSRAASFSKKSLDQARRALDRAEGAFEAAPGSDEARALAYVALRRAELARVSGDYEHDREIAADLRVHKTELAMPVESAPAGAATAEESPALAAEDSTAQGEQNLAAQHDAAALQTLIEDLAGLEPLATTKEETRGMVITLDSSFLFVPKKAEILAAAREKLDKIARALARLGEAKTIVVEGHTDSTGSDAKNLELSKERANALKNYLVGHGIAADRIRAEGRGELAPIATNDTAEGRALNRRIEIVVEKPEGR